MGKSFSSKRFYKLTVTVLGVMLVLIMLCNLVIVLQQSFIERSFLVRLVLVIMPWIAFIVAILFALISIKTVYSLGHVVERLRFLNRTKDFNGRVDSDIDATLNEIIGEINHLLATIKQKDQQVNAIKKVIERKEHEDQLLWLEIEHNLCLAQEEAERDVLTELYNRKAIEDKFVAELDSARQNEQSLSVLMADLDYFKRVNDTYGHQVGDEVLKIFADTLRSSIRAGDVAARYGGEEFIVILPGTSAQDAIKVAERISAKFTNAVKQKLAQHEGLNCTISIGVADYPGCSGDKDKLIAYADAALLEAKDQGRNRIIYYGDIRKLRSKTA